MHMIRSGNFGALCLLATAFSIVSVTRAANM